MAAPDVWYGEPELPADAHRERLERRITELAAHVHAATAKLLSLVRAYDERAGWANTGAKSCAHWLNWSCGISLGVAREKVRVAHALARMPLVRERFEHGDLSYSQVRALSRVVTPENEELLLHWAQRSTAAQLERIVSAMRRCGGDVTASAQAGQSAYGADFAVPERKLDTWYDDDGSLNLRACLPADEGAVLMKALEIAREQLWRQARQASPQEAATHPLARWEDKVCEDTGDILSEGQQDQPDTFSVPSESTEPNENDSINDSAELPNDFAEAPLPEGPALRAMALCALARSFIEGQGPTDVEGQGSTDSDNQTPAAPVMPPVIPRPLGEHFQVHVHLDLRQLRPEHKDPLPAHAAHAHDCPLSEKTLRRLSCDASRVAIIHGDKGEILSVGRRSRGIPPALRRALRARDQGCRFPGCSEHRHVDAHHVEHWAEGGDTALSNLVELCHHHHRLVHEGGFSLRNNADGEVTFLDPKGKEIANSWPRASLPDNPVQRLRHRQRHLNIDWRSCRSGWTGEPLNINDAIQVLESRGWLGASAEAPAPDP